MPTLRASQDRFETARRRSVSGGLVFFGAMLLLSSPADARQREPKSGTETSRANLPRVGEERVSVEETRNGLRLHLVADLGNVKILTASPSERPQVRCKVRIETDARTPEARNLLKEYSLTVKSTAAGVWITGATPQSTRGQPPAQFWVNFEVDRKSVV